MEILVQLSAHGRNPQKFFFSFLLARFVSFIHGGAALRINDKTTQRRVVARIPFWSVSNGFPRRCDWLRITDMAKGATEVSDIPGMFFFATWPAAEAKKSLIFSQAASIAPSVSNTLLLNSLSVLIGPGNHLTSLRTRIQENFWASSFQNVGNPLPGSRRPQVLYLWKK